jgi:hypothetical protein
MGDNPELEGLEIPSNGGHKGVSRAAHALPASSEHLFPSVADSFSVTLVFATGSSFY